jgi:hypothetical protein
MIIYGPTIMIHGTECIPGREDNVGHTPPVDPCHHRHRNGSLGLFKRKMTRSLTLSLFIGRGAYLRAPIRGKFIT